MPPTRPPGIASLGGRPAFVGSIGDEASSRWYAEDLEAEGVRCTLATAPSGQPTGSCHVLVTADGQRSMATHLGAASELEPTTVEAAGLDRARVVYLEGYLLDVPAVAHTVERTLELARSAGTLVSLSLSDPFVVSRHREQIAKLLSSGSVDLVFGNETEMLELTGATSRSAGLAELASLVPVAVMTLGAEGAAVATGSGTASIAGLSGGAGRHDRRRRPVRRRLPLRPHARALPGTSPSSGRLCRLRGHRPPRGQAGGGA